MAEGLERNALIASNPIFKRFRLLACRDLARTADRFFRLDERLDRLRFGDLGRGRLEFGFRFVFREIPARPLAFGRCERGAAAGRLPLSLRETCCLIVGTNTYRFYMTYIV